MLMFGKTRGKQAGIASIVVVSVLVVVMSLVAIGFSRLMNRSLQQSTNSALNSAAEYAARSAINDALSYAKTNPTAEVSDCNSLISGTGALKDAAKLSEDTKYTCVLIDPTPIDLVYQKLPPLQSQVVRMTTCKSDPTCVFAAINGGSIMFSWESFDRSFSSLPNLNDPFYDEKRWSESNYEPVLRVSLYPILSGGDLSAAKNSSKTKTYFFYPKPKTTDTVTTIGYGADGRQDVQCAQDKSQISTGNFKGTADYNCNVIINNLEPAQYYYVRLTPVYNQTNVKIKANDDGNNVLEFQGVQSIIDTTATSGSAVKRLQARVDASTIYSGRDYNISPDENSIPDFALRSSNQVCKRFNAPENGAQAVYLDNDDKAKCTLSIVADPCSPQLATVTTEDATGVGANRANLNGTLNPHCGTNNYRFWYGTDSSNWSSNTPAGSVAADSNTQNITASITGLLPSNTYSYYACAHIDGQTGGNAPAQVKAVQGDGTNCGVVKSFTTPGGSSGAPSVNLVANPASITVGQSSTLTWSGGNITSCNGQPWTNKTGISDSQVVSPSSSTSYTISCTGTGGSISDSASITVNGVPAPPPPAPPPPPPPPPPSTGTGKAPECYINLGSDGNPLGWGCSNSNSGGVLSGPTVDSNGCVTWIVSDWNYAGIGSASSTVCPVGASAPPPVVIGVPPSNCPPGWIGNPNDNSCFPPTVYDPFDPANSQQCPPGQIGTPPNNCYDPPVVYAPPWSVTPVICVDYWAPECDPPPTVACVDYWVWWCDLLWL